MSWVEKVESGVLITTGDGKQYEPLWKNATYSVNYNISEFTFQEVAGTLVRRGQPMGRKFPIEFYFQGDTNIEQSNEFKQSADDSRPWRLSHPLYDDILCHPVALKFDDTNFNETKITGVVIETINELYPQGVTSPVDQVDGFFDDTQENLAQDFATKVPEPDAATKEQMNANLDNQYEKSKGGITDTNVFEEYRNAFSKATAAVNFATSQPLQAIALTQNMLTYPRNFQDTVQNRIALLRGNYDQLVTTLETIASNADKYLFENNASAVVSAMAITAANPIGEEYASRTDVLNVIDSLQDVSDNLIAQLDALQSGTGGEEDGYIPGADGLNALSTLLNFTLTNLMNIALGAAQERTIILTAKDDVINLAHRFYGLDAADENLNRLIDQNKISMEELYELEPGREITYLV